MALGKSRIDAVDPQEEIDRLRMDLSTARAEEAGWMDAAIRHEQNALRLFAAAREAQNALHEIEMESADEEGKIPLPDKATTLDLLDEVLSELALYGERPPTVNEEPMLVEDADGAPLPWCPECVAGKHPNCTHEVLAEVDGEEQMVPCGCEQGGHR